MLVYLLEYSNDFYEGSRECGGIFSNKEDLINSHPIFKLPNLQKQDYPPSWREIWISSEDGDKKWWVFITIVNLDDNLPIYDSNLRELINFPEYYDRTFE